MNPIPIAADDELSQERLARRRPRAQSAAVDTM
jgi:hypothetical protein